MDSDIKIKPDSVRRGDDDTLRLVLARLKEAVPGNEENCRMIDWLLWLCLQRYVDQEYNFDGLGPGLKYNEIFSVSSTYLLEEVKQVCAASSPEIDREPLKKYLTSGRGLLLLISLRLTVHDMSSEDGDLIALLLTLSIFLLNQQNVNREENDFLPVNISEAIFDHSSSHVKTKITKRSNRTSSNCKPRKMASSKRCLAGFPDPKLTNAIHDNVEVGENLAEFEHSLSSEEEVIERPDTNSQVKYIPINYFAYFDNADMESDEVTNDVGISSEDVVLNNQPFKEISASTRSIGLLSLELVFLMTKTGGILSTKQQTTRLQLAMVAAQNLQAPFHDPVSLSLLTGVLLHNLKCLQFRPDLLDLWSQSSQSVCGVLSSVICKPQFSSLTAWCGAVTSCLELARITTGPALCHQLVWSTLAGLDIAMVTQSDETPAVVMQVVKCILDIVEDPDKEWDLLDLLDKLLIFTLHPALAQQTQYQTDILYQLSSVFSHHSYPAEQLTRLTRHILEAGGELLPTKSVPAFLVMLEQAVENLTEREHEPWHQVEERDSALTSSTDHISSGTDEVSTQEFSPYLAVLIDPNKELAVIDLTIQHLERLVSRSDADTRHLLALQVVLPYLALILPNLTPDTSIHCETMLEITCRLVSQQPTAMALIRNQQVWRQVKSLASFGGNLSRPAQQVIKNIVLNSHKFSKIRLSEAEAMALQDDENDNINFDQRDRNAQYWLFKQLYHVLVQSSIQVMNKGWPDSFPHLVAAWNTCLELVKKVPDFLVFAVERGVIGLNKQLLDVLCQKVNECGNERNIDEAEMIAVLTNYLIFFVVSQKSWLLQSPHEDVSDLEEYVVKNVFRRLETSLSSKTLDDKFKRTLLSKILDGVRVTENGDVDSLNSLSDVIPEDASETGYEGDAEEMVPTGDRTSSPKCGIAFKPGLKFFCNGLLTLFRDERVDDQLLYTFEYLCFKLVKLVGKDSTSLRLLEDYGFLGKILMELFHVQEKCPSKHQGVLINLSKLILQLTSESSRAFLSQETIKNLFKFLAQPNTLRSLFIKYVAEIITSCAMDKSYPGISLIPSPRKPRTRVSSNLSSDSGLDSNCSISSCLGASYSMSRRHYIRDAAEDLEDDFSIVLRLKVELSSGRKSDDWVDLISVENRNESIGIHLNIDKGLKLTLSNNKGTFAAAETNFQSMFKPGKWIHLVFNIGTILEGNRNTKTLSAFIDCCRVWDVGLSSDKRSVKVKKEKFLCLTVGSTSLQSSGGSSVTPPNVMVSDVFFYANSCFSLQDTLEDFLLDSRSSFGTCGAEERVNLSRLGERLPDLVSYCHTYLEPGYNMRPRKLVAHFSPVGMWNNRSFPYWIEANLAWSFIRGIFSSGGLECLLLLPSVAIETDNSDELVAVCFAACFASITSDQETFLEFLDLGGFNLISNILKSKNFSLGECTLQTFLESSCHTTKLYNTVLLVPELLKILLNNPEVAKKYLSQILEHVNLLIDKTNPSVEFNILFLQRSGVLQCILNCLIALSKDNFELPYDTIDELFMSIPPSTQVVVILHDSCLILCPPHLLYLNSGLPTQPGSPLPQRDGIQRESKYLSEVHSQEVVDVSSLLGSKNESKELVFDNLQIEDEEINLDYLEREEDVVAEWEVIVQPPSAPSSIPRNSNTSLPPSSVNFLLSKLLSSLLSGYSVLPDSQIHDLLPLHAILPLIGHTSSEVHSPAISLLGAMLQHSSVIKKNKFVKQHGSLQLIAGMIITHPASKQLVESVLGLLFGHPVNIDIPLEFDENKPTDLNLDVACVLPPLMTCTVTNVSLCHNLLTHVHELAANIPSLLLELKENYLCQTLLSLLVQIGDQPGETSDICGVYESDLIIEDVNNLLRLFVVQYVDQNDEHYDFILDLFFLCSSLSKDEHLSETAIINLSSSLCLLIEESLYTLQKSISDDALYKPSHCLDSDDLLSTEPMRKIKKVPHTVAKNVLIARFNKFCKFGVNYLSTMTVRNSNQCGSPEELGLTNSLFSMFFDLECSLYKKKGNNPLLKGIQDRSTLAGTLLLIIFSKSGITRNKRLEVVRNFDALPNCQNIIGKLIPTKFGRNSLRHCILLLVEECGLMSPVDSEMVMSFYGKIVNKTLFPDGLNEEGDEVVHHPSHGPWLAEQARCRRMSDENTRHRAHVSNETADSLTNIVVGHHDDLSQKRLESERVSFNCDHEALKTLNRIVENQCNPLGLWFDPAFEPQSLILENVTGTSGIFTRLRSGFVGLSKPRYFKEEYRHLSTQVPSQFPKLLSSYFDLKGTISLSDQLGGLEQIQTVETVDQVTATDKYQGELVLSKNTVHFVSAILSWSVEFMDIEAVCKRRYQLKDIAAEFFLDSGEVHLLVFRDKLSRSNVLSFLLSQKVQGKVKTANLPVTTKLWRQGLLTNFQYLMELNRLAGRTINDLMQYPVFPWILADYNSPHLNLLNMDSYRNLRRPIAVQKDGSCFRYKETYNILSEEGSGPGLMGPYHYASHYSNTGIVLHFLVRLPPFTGEFIKFQDGNFDLPDRSFHKLATSWLMASEVSASDVKELIPQLFYLPELFLNSEGYALGQRQNGQEVDEVELPDWAKDPRTFVKVHRQALESSIIRRELCHWIDMVFGYKQTGQPAIEAVNVFHPATYHSNQVCDGDLDEVEQKARQTMVETYGQTPLQLFTTPHPLPVEELVESEEGGGSVPSVLSTISGMVWGDYVGAPGQPTPTVVWQQNQGVSVASMMRLENNEMFGLPSRTLLVGKFNQVSGLVSGSILSWGFTDNYLHCNVGTVSTRVGGEERKLLPIFAWDQPACGVSHPRVSSIWLGHQSGLLSVFSLSFVSEGPLLGIPTRLHGHLSTVSSIILCPEFGVAVSAGQDGTVISRDLHSMQLLHHARLTLPLSHHNSSLRVAMSAKSGDIAVAMADTVSLFTINLNRLAECKTQERITAITFSNQEEGVSINTVVVGLQSGLVVLYSSLDLTHLREINLCPSSPVTSLVYSEDSQNLAIATQDGVVTILEKSGNRGLNRTPKYVTVQ